MRIVAAVLVGLVLFVAWQLGVLGIVVAVLAWVWCLAPVPMTVLYAAAVCGLAASFVYPRYRPGVLWADVVIRNPQAQRPGHRAVSGAEWTTRSVPTWTGSGTSRIGRWRDVATEDR